jgi:hypothetical protein
MGAEKSRPVGSSINMAYSGGAFLLLSKLMEIPEGETTAGSVAEVTANLPGAHLHGIIRILSQRLSQPPIRYYVEADGTEMSLEDYDNAIKASANPPVFSGNVRAVDGAGNCAEYPWLGQGGRG